MTTPVVMQPADAMAAEDAKVHVQALKDKRNLWFILDNRLAYEDI